MSRECQLQAPSRCLTLRLEDSEIIRSVVRLSPHNFLAMLCLLHLQPPGILTAQAKLAHICHPWKQCHRLTIKSLAMAFGATFWIQTIAGRVSRYGEKVLQVEKGKKTEAHLQGMSNEGLSFHPFPFLFSQVLSTLRGGIPTPVNPLWK